MLKLGEEGVARLAAKQDEAATIALENSIQQLESDRLAAVGQDAKIAMYDVEIDWPSMLRKHLTTMPSVFADSTCMPANSKASISISKDSCPRISLSTASRPVSHL